jgi:ATP/maltotriose-dependent transcriptional regulator MalT
MTAAIPVVPPRPSISETRRVLVDRERVLALDEGLPILVIEAPSGYGKTVLAELWLERQRDLANTGWVSLDAASADPVLFLDQLLRAVGAEVPAKSEFGLDDEGSRTERFALLCTRIEEEPRGWRLVIDDAHVLAHTASRPWLERLLAFASAGMRICLTMQPVKVELGLGRLTAQGRASWIQASNLALTKDEVSEFARQRGHAGSAAQLDWLYGATEGWPALTQLALAVPLDPTPSGARNVAGSGPLREYIYERFVDGLSADDRDVLWMLACLGAAPVALLIALDQAAVKIEIALLHFRALGIVQNKDADDAGAVTLHALIREGVSHLLDDGRQRPRAVLVREAAEWYWRNGDGAAAVRHALEDAGLAPVARGWLASLGFAFNFRNGQHQTLLDLVHRWERVAEAHDPEIDEIAAWAQIFQRQFVEAETRLNRLDAAEDERRRATAGLQRAVMLALRDDHVNGGTAAKRWIDQNAAAHSFHMGVACTVYAFGLNRQGRFDEAHVSLREAMYCFNLAQSAYGVVWAHLVGSLVHIQSGHYRAAIAQIESGLARCPASQGFGSMRALLRAIEAFVRYERNDLERAREAMGEALPLLSDQGVVDALGLGYAAAARGRAAATDFGTALDILSEGELIGLQRDFPRLTLMLRTERALLLARAGAASQARTIADALDNEDPTCATIGLLRARFALADGDCQRAHAHLEPILAQARRLQRQNQLCEILLQVASTQELCGNEAAAFAALVEALEIGSAEGYVRTFLDEGKSLRDLIQRLLDRRDVTSRPALALAEQLVALAQPRVDAALPADKTLSFNKRERQILALLDEGLSNAQLAKRCFISEGTVKWYLHNLYEKLGVGNRTALLRAARERGVKA